MAGEGRHTADAALIAALVAGRPSDEAADLAGVSVRTVYRRLDDPEFVAALEAARARVVNASTAALGKASTRAVRTLVTLMSWRKPAAIRLAAARAVLDLGAKYREQGELADRLAALEAAWQAEMSSPLRRRA
jgi:uncharacterized membrane protein